MLARVLDAQFDRNGRVEALSKALQYSPEDIVLKHQYGVALSRAGRPDSAIDVFSEIIDAESKRVPIRDTLLLALKTRILNFRRIGRSEDAITDLNFAKELIEAHPYLSHYKDEIRSLEEDGMESD